MASKLRVSTAATFGAVVRGSSAPSSMIPPPLSEEAAVDPEEAEVLEGDGYGPGATRGNRAME